MRASSASALFSTALVPPHTRSDNVQTHSPCYCRVLVALHLKPVFYREILLSSWMPHNGRLREQHIHAIPLAFPTRAYIRASLRPHLVSRFVFPLFGGISLVVQRKAVNAAAHISSREAHGSPAAAQPDPPPTLASHFVLVFSSHLY